MKRKVVIVVCTIVSLLVLCSCKKGTNPINDKGKTEVENMVHNNSQISTKDNVNTNSTKSNENERIQHFFIDGTVTGIEFKLGDTILVVSVPSSWENKFIVEKNEDTPFKSSYLFLFPLKENNTKTNEIKDHYQFLCYIHIDTNEKFIENIGNDYGNRSNIDIAGRFNDLVAIVVWPSESLTTEGSDEEGSTLYETYVEMIEDARSDNFKINTSN